MYYDNDDTMVFDTSELESDIVNGVLEFDIGTFHRNLINLYRNTLSVSYTHLTLPTRCLV